MSCKHYEKMIFLYKELNDQERVNLHQHISECETCKVLLQSVTNTFENFSTIINERLSAESGELKQKILMNLPEKSNTRIIEKLKQNIELFFGAKALKTVIAFMLIFFIANELYMMKKITHLEQQVLQLSINNEQLSINSQIVELLDQNQIITTNQLIKVINRQSFMKINKEMLLKITSEIPELKSINLQDGINHEEMQKIVDYSAKYLKQKKQFNSKGEIHV